MIEMTKGEAAMVALTRAEQAGLGIDDANALSERVMPIFHEEFTRREWKNFVDEEIWRTLHPNEVVFGQHGFVVMIRDRGQDEPRRLARLYPDHPSAICVKHNLMATGRYNSVFVREATQKDIEEIGEGE